MHRARLHLNWVLVLADPRFHAVSRSPRPVVCELHLTLLAGLLTLSSVAWQRWIAVLCMGTCCQDHIFLKANGTHKANWMLSPAVMKRKHYSRGCVASWHDVESSPVCNAWSLYLWVVNSTLLQREQPLAAWGGSPSRNGYPFFLQILCCPGQGIFRSPSLASTGLCDCPSAGSIFSLETPATSALCASAAQVWLILQGRQEQSSFHSAGELGGF